MEPLSIDCIVAGGPRSHVTWKKDGLDLKTINDSRIEVMLINDSRIEVMLINDNRIEVMLI